METNKQKQRERLEEIFYTVNAIKQDLHKATRIKIEVVKHLLTITSYVSETCSKKIEWRFDPKNRSLERAGKLMILDVTDFMVQYFPEANSVLYRIELDGKEQIRGYIFLMNMKKEG